MVPLKSPAPGDGHVEHGAGHHHGRLRRGRANQPEVITGKLNGWVFHLALSKRYPDLCQCQRKIRCKDVLSHMILESPKMSEAQGVDLQEGPKFTGKNLPSD